MQYILNITDWNVNLYWHNVLIIGNWTHFQVCSIMLVKTTQYKSSEISSANLLRALQIFDLPPAISPELNKCPGRNPVSDAADTEYIARKTPMQGIMWIGRKTSVLNHLALLNNRQW